MNLSLNDYKNINPSEITIQLLINLYSKNKFEKILIQTLELLNEFPKSLFLHNIQGAAYLSLSQSDLALKSFKKVLSIDPNFAPSYVNIGIIFKEKKEHEHAIKNFKIALKINPNLPDAFYNIGIISSEEGKLDSAIKNYKKAIKLNPNYFQAYSNLGNALRAKGNIEDAIESYKKAIQLNHNYAHIYYNLGIALNDKGNMEEAIKNYLHAIVLKPDYYEAYSNLGNSQKNLGNINLAIEAYQKSININPDYDYNYTNIGVCLKNIVLLKPIQGLKEIIIKLLVNKKFVPSNYIVKAAVSLIKFDPFIEALFTHYDFNDQKNNTDILLQKLNKNYLLIEIMKACPIPDVIIEKLLQKIRFIILKNINKIQDKKEFLNFTTALAIQCFINEYIYDETKIEIQTIFNLEKSIEKEIFKGKKPNPLSISILACYRPLHQYIWCKDFEIPKELSELGLRQILEVRQEKELKNNIPTIGNIKDTVSIKVKKQYEVNPYPRWINTYTAAQSKSIIEFIRETDIKIFNKKIIDCKNPKILIAGCGTGEHSIGTASRFRNCQIVAVDLSLSSLAYAQRKTNELGLDNIKYIQSDILDIAKLEKKFDIIECCGVLHHMDDPMLGWQALSECLEPNGLMKIGLYSDKARQDIKVIRDEIAIFKIKSNKNSMKKFRKHMFSSSLDHHKNILLSPDIYSLSNLRDLLFHVQEHRFTINLIEDYLKDLNFKFCGFEGQEIIQKFKNQNKKSDIYDLTNWISFEDDNPTTFANMYQFWCQKK